METNWVNAPHFFKVFTIHFSPQTPKYFLTIVTVEGFFLKRKRGYNMQQETWGEFIATAIFFGIQFAMVFYGIFF